MLQMKKHHCNQSSCYGKGVQHERATGKPYCKSTLCVVSEKNWDTNDACIVCAAVGEKARPILPSCNEFGQYTIPNIHEQTTMYRIPLNLNFDQCSTVEPRLSKLIGGKGVQIIEST